MNNSSPKQSGKKKKIVIFLIKSVISVIILWLVFQYFESENIRSQMSHANPFWLMPGIISIILINVLKSWRFLLLGKVMNLDIPGLRCFFAHLIAPIVGFVTPGKLGESVKILYMRYSRRELGFVFIIERFLDMITLMIVASCGFLLSEMYPIYFLLMIAALITGVVLMLKMDWFVNLITRLLFKKEFFGENWFSKRIKQCMNLQMISPVIMTLVVWGLGYFAFWSFARSIDIKVTYPETALVFSWAIIMGVLSSLPGGVGVREGSITFMMHALFEVPKSAGAALAVLNLGIHYIVLTILSLFGLMLYRLTGLSRN